MAFVEEIIALLRVWFLVIFFGKSIGFMSALSIIGFSYLAGMGPIPGALGTHEVIQTFAFNALKLGAGAGIAFVLIVRGAEILLALIGLCLFLRLGFKLTEENLLKKQKFNNV